MDQLRDILILFGLAFIVIFICQRLRVPTVLGLILTGVLAGRHGLKLVYADHDVEALAEIGVVLLLFTIGLEFSLSSLAAIRRAVLIGGTLQVFLTIALVAGVMLLFGRPLPQDVFVGFFISLSSTAIVLKVLQERAEIESPQGRTALGMLIFQDLAVVPMMLFVPLLSGGGERFLPALGSFSLRAVVVMILTFALARWIVPFILYQAARFRDREMFLLSIIVIGLGIALMTSAAGLSLALGAFLAGLIISESEFSHRALGDILPFRDLFTSLFFVSIGMLLDVAYFLAHPLLIVALAGGVITIKATLAGMATLTLGLPVRIAILVGLSLAQVGEFSFVLLKSGQALLGPETYQIALGVTILTMMATPFLIRLAPLAAEHIARLPLPESANGGILQADTLAERLARTDHLIIVGYGPNGRVVATAASEAGIPHVIIEMNADTVSRGRGQGLPIFYGDATKQAVLEHAGIGRAHVIVMAISDPAALRRAIEMARRLNPLVHIIARSRFVAEAEPLYALGADEVIPEEFETSIEILTRALLTYRVSHEKIESIIAHVRSEGFQTLRRTFDLSRTLDFNIPIANLEIQTVRLAEDSPAVGKTLAELAFRQRYEITLLAIRRGSETVPNPSGDTRLEARDSLIILGAPDKIPPVEALCAPGASEHGLRESPRQEK